MRKLGKEKRYSILGIVFAGLALFNACEKPLTIEIPLQSVTIELDDVTVGDSVTQKSTFTAFNAVQTISLNSIEGLSEQAMAHIKHIKSAEVGEASIIITSTDEEGTVEEFVLSASELGNFNIPHYELGTVYTDNVKNYASQFIMKLLKNNSLDIRVSGKTDVPAGSHLKIKIVIDNITLLANPIREG